MSQQKGMGRRAMMTCKQVSTAISTGDFETASLWTRLSIRFHLAMCRHCSAFVRQIQALTRAARRSSAEQAGQAPADLGRRVAEKLLSPR